MPTRDSAPNGAPCWVDLMSSDPERSRTFYAELFGWDADEPNEEFGGYFNFRRDGSLIAGGMPRMPDTPAEAPDVWSVYLATDDIQKTFDTAASHGSQVLAPPMAVGDFGSMAIITDPTGSNIGLWQPETHPGFQVIGEPGAPAWFELHTRDLPSAVAFYRDVFGFQTSVVSDTDEFRYTTLGYGEEPDDQVAGVADDSASLPEGVPPYWLVYFGVADTDAAVAKVVELGGSLRIPAEDTPWGRIAGVSDPTGAQFMLMSAGPADQ